MLDNITCITVDPSKQDELVKMLDDPTEKVIKDLPGFVSANIHRGFDGRHAVNYAAVPQPAGIEASGSPARPWTRCSRTRQRSSICDAAALAKFEPNLYEVASVYHR